MITERDLRALDAEQRREVRRLLSSLDAASAADGPPGCRRRAVLRAVSVLAVVALVGWTVVLSRSLPTTSVTHSWRVAWVGLDLVEAAALAVTAWAIWRERQVLVIAAVISATLLVADAWFDLALSWGTADMRAAVLAAALLELPLAALLLVLALRVVRATIANARARLGIEGPGPRLRDLTLRDPAQVSPPDPDSDRRPCQARVLSLLGQ